MVALGLPPDFGASKAEARVAHAASAGPAASSLCCPESHFDPDLRCAVEGLASTPLASVRARWASELEAFRSASAALRSATESALGGAPASVAGVLRAASPCGVHVCLLRWAGERAGVLATGGVCSDLLAGFPLVGDIPADPDAPPQVRPARFTPEQVLAAAPLLAPRLARKARAGLSRLSPEASADLSTVYAKSREDSTTGRLGPLEPLGAQHLRLPLSRRFAVRQLSSKGSSKIREIDDLHESQVNEAATITRRIRMGRLASLVATARHLRGSTPDLPLHVVKSDFRSAYRCVPISAGHLPFSQVLIPDPASGQLYVALQLAMPFGAIGAVYAWDRLASLVTAILRRLFSLPVIRYVDDLFLLFPAAAASEARGVLVEVVTLLGLVLDPVKTPEASPSEVVLGVRVTCRPHSLQFEVDSAKVTFWLRLLRDMAEAPRVSAVDLARLAGRLSFGCWAVWGPGARARLAPFFKPSRFVLGRLSAAARADLLWWASFLSSDPLLSSSFPTRPWVRPPFVLYTDAEGSGGVGAALLTPGAALRWFGGSVSAGLRRRVARRWGYSKCPIFLLEAAVPLACLRVFGEGLRSQRLLIFVDNTHRLVRAPQWPLQAQPSAQRALLHFLGARSAVGARRHLGLGPDAV